MSSTGQDVADLTIARLGTGDESHSASAQLRASIQEHAPLLWLVAIFLGVCVALRLATGDPGLEPLNRITVYFWLRHSLVGLGIPLAYHLVDFHTRFFIGLKRDPARYEGTIVRRFLDYRRENITLFRVAGTLLFSALLSVLYTTFWAFKRTIPRFHPFSWDPALSRLDETLHLGHEPWMLLQPVFGSSTATVVLDKLYYLWFIAILVVIAWQAWRADRRARMHFLLAYSWSWVFIGTIMAIALSSAGPCYYGRIVPGPDPYAPLMTFLYRVDAGTPLLALRVQEWLWDGYLGLGYFQGISAMPSMHVALPVLFALGSLKVGRWLTASFALYTVAILLGSVHLGWHYAVDGYVAIVVALAMWWVIGRWLGARSSYTTL